MLPVELLDLALFASIPRFGDMTIHGVIDLERSFDREKLERALGEVIEAFPVLGCRYEQRLQRDAWVPVQTPLARAMRVLEGDVDVEAETERWVREPLDPERERPVRLLSMPRKKGSRLIISVSHIASDGAGIGAVGHVLGARLYGQKPRLPTDARRDFASVFERLSLLHAPVLGRDIASVLWKPAHTLKSGRRERRFGERGQASYRHVVISQEKARSLKETAQAVGGSMNDVLVAGMARAAAKRSSEGPVPVLYTMDLRRYQRTPRLSVANSSTIMTLHVPRADVADLGGAIASVASMTGAQKRGLEGPALVLTALAATTKTPHEVLRRIVPSLQPLIVDLPLNRGLIVTNVGKLDEGLSFFGDDVESVRIVGPTARGIDVPLVIAYGYRGELQLELFAGPEIGEKGASELEADLRDALGV